MTNYYNYLIAAGFVLLLVAIYLWQRPSANPTVRLSRIPLQLTSFWPLLVVIAVLGWIVWLTAPISLGPDAARWANLRVIPLKVLLVCVAMYLAHRYDERAFAALSRRIEMLLLQAHARMASDNVDAKTQGDATITVGIMLLALALTAIARAIVLGAIVIALCTGG